MNATDLIHLVVKVEEVITSDISPIKTSGVGPSVVIQEIVDNI